MNWNLFYIILLFFLLGGIGIYFSGKRQSALIQKNNWLKYYTYFFIVVSMSGGIYFVPKIFPWICLLIVFAGLFEILHLQKQYPQKTSVFYTILFTYFLVSCGFYLFSHSSQTILLGTFLSVCIFDAFCQISGQLFGKRKMCSQLSPNKTYEGLFGGLFAVISSSFIIGKMLNIPLFYAVLSGFSICIFSFVGDLSASWIKRKYDVKDFSSALPGHGGFLDRFDSFMLSGTFIYLSNILF